MDMDIGLILTETVFGWLGRGLIILIAYWAGKYFYREKGFWESVLIVLAVAAFVGFYAGSSLGETVEGDVDPFGGGRAVTEREVTAEERVNTGMIWLLVLALPGLFGINEQKKEEIKSEGPQ